MFSNALECYNDQFKYINMEKNTLKTISLHTISEMICLHFSVFSTILKRMFVCSKRVLPKIRARNTIFQTKVIFAPAQFPLQLLLLISYV